MKKQLIVIFGLTLIVVTLPLVLVAVHYRQQLRAGAVGELNDTAALSLEAVSPTNIEIDDEVTLDLKLNTGGQDVDGVDIILTFNQAILELKNLLPNQTTNLKTFLPLTNETFDQAKVINGANNTGRIEFGAASFDMSSETITGPVNGTDILLARLVFSGLVAGSTDLEFDFEANDPNKTTDSNVVSRSGEIVDDILGSVAGISINVSSGATATPTVTPTPDPERAQLDVKVKFQGVSAQRPDQEVAIWLREGINEPIQTRPLTVSASGEGVYSGRLLNLPPGTYEFLVKGPSHLRRSFGSLVLNLGDNEADWSSQPLLAGDALADNKVNIFDVAIISQDFGSRCPDPCSSRADFDFDGDVDIFDLVFISENYGQEGDE